MTNEAEKKSRQHIIKCTKLNPNAKIIICGCASENNIEQFKSKTNVHSIIGTENKQDILSIISEKTNRKTLTPQIVEKTIKQAQAGTDLDMKMSNTALATASKILMGHWKYGDQLGKILGMNEAQLIKFRLNALDKEYKQTHIKGHFTVIKALKGRLKELKDL